MNLNFNMIAWINMLATNGLGLCEGGDFLPKCICEPKYNTKPESLKRALKPRFCECAVSLRADFPLRLFD